MQFENIIESVFKITIENVSVTHWTLTLKMHTIYYIILYTISMHCVSRET